MKTLIIIFLLTFYSLKSYSNGTSLSRSPRDVSQISTTNYEAPMDEDSLSLKSSIPIFTTNLITKTTKSNAHPFSFHAIKSLFFKEKCDEPKEMKKLTKNQKIFHEVLKILLVTLSIGLVALLVSIAGLGALVFMIPL